MVSDFYSAIRRFNSSVVVLILVVMEYGLRPNTGSIRLNLIVLILVVMEYGLRPKDFDK